jgi:predicted permease
MQSLLQDIRYGVRALRKSPALTAVIAITIALGVGANTAMFSFVNGFLIRPLPVPSPNQLVALAIQEKNTPLGARGFSYPEFVVFRQQAAAWCEVFGQALARGALGFSADGRTDRVSITGVSKNYFSGLGVEPALGRFILPGEGEAPGERPVMVLGYSFWQKRFAGDPSVIGKQVRIDGKPVEIVGVVPKEFHGSFSIFEMDGYVPLSTLFPDGAGVNFWSDRNTRLVLAMGRLHPGVSLAKAQSLFDVISERQAEQYPASDKGFSVRVLPERLSRPIPYANNQFLLISGLFLVLSAIILLLACTNVVNILMAQASSRMRELAIRTALGGSRFRLVRQMLTETMLLASLGGLLGVLLGRWVSGLSASIHPSGLPLQLDFGFDWPVFAYAFALILFTGIFVGLSPALNATKTDVNAVLHQRGGGVGSGRHQVRRDLMVLQVAGSLMLLIVAGLFVRSLQNAEHIGLGFNPDHVLNVTLDPRENDYNDVQTGEFYRELEAKVKAMPGVQSASLTASVPISTFPSGRRIYVEHHPLPPDRPLPNILFNRIDPGYFQTLSIPVLLGRGFLDSDNASAPLVAVINQTMANRLWPGEEPIGKRFSMISDSGPFLEVVGVVRDSKYQSIAEDPQPYFYLPLEQNYTSFRILQIRSSIAPALMTNQIQRAIRELNPAITIVDVRTMEESLQGATGFFIFRLGASLAAFMGTLGLILAVVGVYGMVSYTAVRRTQEIGIRISLGASRLQILELVVGQGMKIVLLGVAVGLLAAWALTRTMTHLLVGVSPDDPIVYLGVAISLSFVALIASYIPARRATKVDPVVALRYE